MEPVFINYHFTSGHPPVLDKSMSIFVKDWTFLPKMENEGVKDGR